MKAILRSVIFTVFSLAGVFAIVHTSCKEDKCKAIVCAYGGNCTDGTCTCLPGYEGPNCETITRNKFVGGYQVHETGTITLERQYPIAIEQDAEVNYVNIKNLYNFFGNPSVRALVRGDSIFIPNQQILGKIIFGRGSITPAPTGFGTSSIITMRYEVVDSVNNNIVDDFGYYPDIYFSKASLWTKQ